MGKIYSAPKELRAPAIEEIGVDYKKYYKDCEKHVEAVKAWAKAQGGCKESGQEVLFPYADGYARYVVLSLKPVKLLHLDVGDAWEYPYVHRLTASDIRGVIARRNALDRMFSKSKKEKAHA